MNLLVRWHELVVPADLTYFERGTDRLVTNPVLATFKVLDADEFAVLSALARRSEAVDPPAHLSERFIERTLGKLVLNWLVYVPEREPTVGAAEPPLDLVYYAVTDGCNLRCPYCYASSERMLPGELSHDESLDFIEQVAELGASTIVFTGGEPLLRRDLFEIVEHTVNLGVQANIITNATLVRTSERARRMAELFTEVTVSLDGGTAECHDKTRGPGSFEKTAQALRLLNAEGVRPVINHVVTNENIPLLDQLSAFLADLDVTRVRLMQHSDLGRGSGDEFNFGWEQHLQVQDYCWTTPQGSGLLPDYRSATKSGAISGNCGLAGNEIYVTSEGDVFACKLLTDVTASAGNLRSQTLAEMFNAESFVAMRRATVGNGHLIDCAKCYVRGSCGGGCRAYHSAQTGDIARNSRHLCRVLRQTQVSAYWLASGVDKREVVQDRDSLMQPLLVATGEEHPVYKDWQTGGRRRIAVLTG